MRRFLTACLISGLVACSHSQVRTVASGESQENDNIVQNIVKAECPNCSVNIPQCTKANTASAQENFECITTKGSIFKRVRHSTFGLSWFMNNGVVWSDMIVSEKGNTDFTQDEGRNICSNLRAKLPTEEDFIEADKADIQQVWTHFSYGDTHWTTSMKENSDYYGKAVTSSVDTAQYGDTVVGKIRIFNEPKRFIPFLKFTEVGFKIRCIDDSQKH